MKKTDFSFSKASRLEKLPPYLFAELDRAKRQLREKGVDVIDLGVGDPDVPTPTPIIEQLAISAKKPCNHRYPSYEGLLSFREEASRWYGHRFGVTLDPEAEIVTLIGSKEGIAHISLGLLNPGDVALIPDPAYPVYQAGAIFAGATPHYVPLTDENGFLPCLQDIPSEVATKAKLIWLNYPNNPTGASVEIDFFEELVEFAHKFNIIICHDLAYSELSYGDYCAPSLLEVAGAKELAVEFHTLSKSFCMTGWRIGFAVGNKDLLNALKEVKTNVDSGAFQAVQEAGIKALKLQADLIPGIKEIYQQRRDFLARGLQDLGWKISLPRATFYLWIKVPVNCTSFEFAQILLNRCGIVVTPGIGFGPAGEGYIRIAFTIHEDRLKEAIDRLRELKL